MNHLYCTLPTDQSWLELLEESKASGGLYLEANVTNKPHLGNTVTCWKSFETKEERLLHQEDEHYHYIELYREQKWQVFSRQKLTIIQGTLPNAF